ncbi:MAG: hypothetical protein AAF184_19695 [Pseudomonadota bacterium]
MGAAGERPPKGTRAAAGGGPPSAAGPSRTRLPLLHGLSRVAPDWVVLASVRALARLLRWAYAWRANPLRQAAVDLAAVAAGRSIALDPRATYHRFLDNGCATLAAYLDLQRRGLDAALARVELSDAQAL